MLLLVFGFFLYFCLFVCFLIEGGVDRLLDCYNPGTKNSESRIVASLRQDWLVERVPGHPKLHGKDLSHKNQGQLQQKKLS